MTAALLLASLVGISLAALAGTVSLVRRDGYRHVPTRPHAPRLP